MAISTHTATIRRNRACTRAGRGIPTRSSLISKMATVTAEAAVAAQIAQTDSIPTQYDKTGVTDTEITTAISNLVLSSRWRNERTFVHQPSAQPGATANSKTSKEAR